MTICPTSFTDSDAFFTWQNNKRYVRKNKINDTDKNSLKLAIAAIEERQN
jgi:hypothetical protein